MSGPYISLDDSIQTTIQILSRVIKITPLTVKLLSKPPFRYLHDLSSELINTAGICTKLYSSNEMNSETFKEKGAKVQYLTKLIQVLNLSTGETLKVNPLKIVAGQEPLLTNLMLQLLGNVALNRIDTTKAVEMVNRTNRIDKIPSSRSAMKSRSKPFGNLAAKDTKVVGQLMKPDIMYFTLIWHTPNNTTPDKLMISSKDKNLAQEKLSSNNRASKEINVLRDSIEIIQKSFDIIYNNTHYIQEDMSSIKREIGLRMCEYEKLKSEVQKKEIEESKYLEPLKEKLKNLDSLIADEEKKIRTSKAATTLEESPNRKSVIDRLFLNND